MSDIVVINATTGKSSTMPLTPEQQAERAAAAADALAAEAVEQLRQAGAVPTEQQVAILAEILLAADVKAGGLSDAEIAKRAPLFPPWVPGTAVSAGEVYRWDGTLVEVVQAHTTQSDWTPDVVPALFKIHRLAGDAPQPWVQPVGAHDAYQIGDRVTHNGQTWESTATNNVWEPGEFGWVVV